MSVLKPNRGNKTFFSKLKRWVDRLLPFDFEVVHVADRNLGVADFLSRHPTDLQRSTFEAGSLRNEWFTVDNRMNRTSRQQPIKMQNERNSRETSKRHGSQFVQKRKMSQSPSIKQLNEKLYGQSIARINSFKE